MLMDEPFGALDALTREVMQEELNRIWQASGISVMFITHDINEAIFLGDRVAVMTARPGQIIKTVDVDLPRPRTTELKKSPEVLAYHNDLWEALRAQVGIAADAAVEGESEDHHTRSRSLGVRGWLRRGG
jgi:NitT/TauT family transport system ATP-binding protein